MQKSIWHTQSPTDKNISSDQSPDAQRNYEDLPLYYRSVIQFSLRCFHDGKFLSSNLAESWILHWCWDSADELWEHSARWKQGERPHCIHRWLSGKWRKKHNQSCLKLSPRSKPCWGTPTTFQYPIHSSVGTWIWSKILLSCLYILFLLNPSSFYPETFSFNLPLPHLSDSSPSL